MWREENQRTWRKTFGARREPATNSTHMTSGWNRTQATLVGGDCPPHCAIPALQKFPLKLEVLKKCQGIKYFHTLNLFFYSHVYVKETFLILRPKSIITSCPDVK